MADDPMWAVVMFDLPTKTKKQRRAYTSFRNLLKDNGFVKVQYSVYARYCPTGPLSSAMVRSIKDAVPLMGEIRITHLTDQMWSSMIVFFNGKETESEPTPTQLAIF